ncbi:hypothetical protein ACVWY3_004790 [Bradyrhizobium sp. USDA 4486]
MDRDVALVCFGKISLLENLHHLNLAALQGARIKEKTIMAYDNKRCEAATFEGQGQADRSAAAVNGRCLSPNLELGCFIRLISLVESGHDHHQGRWSTGELPLLLIQRKFLTI